MGVRHCLLPLMSLGQKAPSGPHASLLTCVQCRGEIARAMQLILAGLVQAQN